MTVLLHGRDDSFDTTEDGRVREDLDISDRLGGVPRMLHTLPSQL